MGFETQIFVLVYLLTSTALIMRMMVLGNVHASSFTLLEFHCLNRVAYATEAPSSTNVVIYSMTSSFRGVEADLAKYVPYHDALDTTLELQGYILSSVNARHEYASSVV